jgi:hypothetical protein
LAALTCANPGAACNASGVSAAMHRDARAHADAGNGYTYLTHQTAAQDAGPDPDDLAYRATLRVGPEPFGEHHRVMPSNGGSSH